jgi:hypothetical protein
MVDVRDLVKKTVLVKLVSEEGLEFIGVTDEGPFFCRVTAVDDVGLWVENTDFVTTELRDSKGRAVPKKRRRPRRHVVNVLLPWQNVRTIVVFTEGTAERMARNLAGEDREGMGRIGFIR